MKKQNVQVLNDESEVLFEKLKNNYNIDALQNQLATVMATKDPVAYMDANINWEIDPEHRGQKFTSLGFIDQFVHAPGGMQYLNYNPFAKFLKWFKNNEMVFVVKEALCNVASKLPAAIDRKAEVSELLQLALLAVLKSLKWEAFNATILTLTVGILSAMVLSSTDNVCEI